MVSSSACDTRQQPSVTSGLWTGYHLLGSSGCGFTASLVVAHLAVRQGWACRPSAVPRCAKFGGLSVTAPPSLWQSPSGEIWAGVAGREMHQENRGEAQSSTGQA